MFNNVIRRRSLQAQGAWLLIIGALCACTAVHAQAPAQPIQGRVVNGTTGRPMSKATVQYLMMAQGTNPLATQVTDSEGKFRFENLPASGGASPVLLRVEYEGATYSRPVLPKSGSGDMEIQVFEAGHESGMVSAKEHAIFLQPSGGTLTVLEQVVMENTSQPPKTYVNPKGTYTFTLPGTPREGVRVSVEGPGGMPIGQNAVPGEAKSSFAITYPIRPGETQIRVEYALDYKTPFDFAKKLNVVPKQTYVVVPGKEVRINGENLTPTGTDPSTGLMGYQVKQQGDTIRVQVSGEAAAKAPGNAVGEEGDEESAALVPIASPVNNRRWLIVSAAGVVLLVGLIYHYRHG